MNCYSVNDERFKKYGRVLDFDASGIIDKCIKKIDVPKVGTVYVPDNEEIYTDDMKNHLKNEYFGGLDIQIGHCCGINKKLNALEWHKSSEINVAVTDLVLMLGNIWDLDDDYEYDSKKVEIFKVKKGQVIEVYSTTLHYCPVNTENDGFISVVVLPKDTNTDIDFPNSDRFLFMKNKWIISHKDNDGLLKKNVFPGIYGENIEFDGE